MTPGIVISSRSTTLRRNAVGGAIIGTVNDLGEDTVVLETTPLVPAASVPLVPAASVAFSPDELAARLDHYAARADARLPLFRDGGPAPPDPPGAVCCGCGEPCPSNTLVGRGASRGWVSVSRDAYCPGCAAELDNRRPQ